MTTPKIDPQSLLKSVIGSLSEVEALISGAGYFAQRQPDRGDVLFVIGGHAVEVFNLPNPLAPDPTATASAELMQIRATVGGDMREHVADDSLGAQMLTHQPAVAPFAFGVAPFGDENRVVLVTSLTWGYFTGELLLNTIQRLPGAIAAAEATLAPQVAAVA